MTQVQVKSFIAKPGPQGRVLVPALGYLKVIATSHATSGHPTVQGGLYLPMNNLRPWTSFPQISHCTTPFHARLCTGYALASHPRRCTLGSLKAVIVGSMQDKPVLLGKRVQGAHHLLVHPGCRQMPCRMCNDLSLRREQNLMTGPIKPFWNEGASSRAFVIYYRACK